MKPYLIQLNQVTFIPVLGMMAAGGLLMYHLIVSLRIVRKRSIARDYTRFVQGHYTKNGKPTPALILRIQNAYIQEYNQALRSLAGKLFRFKTEPLYGDPSDDASPRDTQGQHDRMPDRR